MTEERDAIYHNGFMVVPPPYAGALDSEDVDAAMDHERPEWGPLDWAMAVGSIALAGVLGFGFIAFMWGWQAAAWAAGGCVASALGFLAWVRAEMRRWLP